MFPPLNIILGRLLILILHQSLADGACHSAINMLTYYASMVDLSRLLARIYAVALDLPEDFFAAKLERHSSQLRLLHYPVPRNHFSQANCGVVLTPIWG